MTRQLRLNDDDDDRIHLFFFVCVQNVSVFDFFF